MKKTVLAVALIASLGLSGCSSMNPFATKGVEPAAGTETAVKDTRVSTEFADQGIKIHYDLFGNLKRIEVYGVAPAWKGNADIIAEADAKEKLVKFIHGETVSTNRRTRIIAKSIDKARDNTLNKIKTVDGSINFTANELEQPEAAAPRKESATPDNTSRRIADRLETTLVDAVTTITSKGRLTGLRKIRSESANDGRTYVAVFQWSEQDQGTSEFIRSRMR